MVRNILMLLAVVILAGCSDDDNPVQPGTSTDTTFNVRIENVSTAFKFFNSGVFNTPVGAGSPGPIGPSGAYEFTFDAGKGSFLSFETMFVPSNDLFFGPDEDGIALFNVNGTPVTGDVTSQVQLWDAGTEVNQEPGLGADQVQRQGGQLNIGVADSISNTVRLVDRSQFTYPAVSEVIRVTITSNTPTNFTVRIENVSTNTTLQPSSGPTQAVPLSPGVWGVHTAPAPFFTVGQPDKGDGLENLSEDGDTSNLATYIAQQTGLTVPLSPGVWAVHTVTAAPFFNDIQPDRGDGLEAVAEDGNPAMLSDSVQTRTGVKSSAIFNTPVGAGGPSAIGPGGAYEFSITASSGDYLSFVTMFVPSNDLFFGPIESGISLFPGGSPLSGDVTTQAPIWDAGTEVNQQPGVGPDQVQRQSAANTGMDENGNVRLITTPVNSDGFTYPDAASVIKVTVTHQ